MARAPRGDIKRLKTSYDGEVPNDDNWRTGLARVETVGTVNMLRPLNPRVTAQVLATSVDMCANEADTPQCVAWYMSALCCVFPGLMDVTRDLFHEDGYRIIMFNETNVSELLVTLKPWVDNRYCLAMVGQLILLMYKNIDDRSYGEYFRKRANAINNEAGLDVNLLDDGTDVLFDIEVARKIRKFAGNHPNLRSAVLVMILNNRGGRKRVNKVCAYLAEIIGWTEMAALVFVFDTLCMTRSPVLQDGRVKTEVQYLMEAYQRITSTEYPQFFRIFYPVEASATLVRSRFETLVEVSRQIRADQKRTVSQFAGGINIRSDPLISSLVELHKAHMETATQDQSARAFHYLTDIDITQMEFNLEQAERREAERRAREGPNRGGGVEGAGPQPNNQ